VITAFDVSILALRAVLGLTMAAHGHNKLFGRGGIAGTAGWFDSIGMKPGALHARVAASAELAAGLGLAVGLLTPLPAAGQVLTASLAVGPPRRRATHFWIR
jgi:putative oxidoreductase